MSAVRRFSSCARIARLDVCLQTWLALIQAGLAVLARPAMRRSWQRLFATLMCAVGFWSASMTCQLRIAALQRNTLPFVPPSGILALCMLPLEQAPVPFHSWSSSSAKSAIRLAGFPRRIKAFLVNTVLLIVIT